MRALVTTSITQQIITLLNSVSLGVTPLDTLNNLILVVVPVSVFSYFFFYFIRRVSVGRGISRLGRYFIMLAFGVGFGGASMYNMTFLTYQIMWALQIGTPQPYQVTIIATAGTLALLAIIGYYAMRYEASVSLRKKIT